MVLQKHGMAPNCDVVPNAVEDETLEDKARLPKLIVGDGRLTTADGKEDAKVYPRFTVSTDVT